MTENKRFTVAVYDENAINGFTVLDLEKPNSSKRLKYENVYIGSKVGCEIVCSFGNSLAEENEQLKQSNQKLNDELQETMGYLALKSGVEKENEQLKKQIERIDFILDDLNGAEYISRDDGIKALNKIDKVIGKR